MSNFTRYAIYHLPAPGPLAQFGAEWLGWDIGLGCSKEGGGPTHLTHLPRKYGFHATVKPPFRLAVGKTVEDLDISAKEIAAGSAPILLEGLELTCLGRFFALTPIGDTKVLNAMAAKMVSGLDHFRAPSSEAELAKRRASGLSDTQEENLTRWGYPYVMDEFRFHMTLTGKTDDPDVARSLLAPLVGKLPLRPYRLAHLSLVGERPDGMFQEIHRYTLSG